MNRPGLASSARAMLARDLRLVWRRRGDATQPLVFVLLVVTLFPLAIGDDRGCCRRSRRGCCGSRCCSRGC